MASQITRDHEEIQRWAAEHGACPAVVSRTGGMLRFEFDPARARELSEVDWNDFFHVFDEKGLELVYDDKPGSRFHKLIYPETAAAKAQHRPRAKPARAGKRFNLIKGGAAAARSGASAAGRGRSASASSSSRRTSPSSRGRASRPSASTGGSRSPRATAKSSAKAPAAPAHKGRKAASGRGAGRTRPSSRAA